MASTSTNKQPMMLDRPASTSTLVRTQTGQLFSSSLLPTSIGNVTKVFDVDQGLTDTQISGAYIDEIFIRYSKDVNIVMDPVTAAAATYTRSGTTLSVTLTNHNFKAGQKLYFDVQTGGAPSEEVTVATVPTENTFTATSSASGTINSSNVNIQEPIDFVFYLTNVTTVTGTTQFLPLFIASVETIPSEQSFSLTEKLILPLINSPVPHAGTNFSSANSTIAPKMRGLMLPRGSGLHVGISGVGSLTNGFYINIQGGYY